MEEGEVRGDGGRTGEEEGKCGEREAGQEKKRGEKKDLALHKQEELLTHQLTKLVWPQFAAVVAERPVAREGLVLVVADGYPRRYAQRR